MTKFADLCICLFAGAHHGMSSLTSPQIDTSPSLSRVMDPKVIGRQTTRRTGIRQVSVTYCTRSRNRTDPCIEGPGLNSLILNHRKCSIVLGDTSWAYLSLSLSVGGIAVSHERRQSELHHREAVQHKRNEKGPLSPSCSKRLADNKAPS